MHSIKHAQWLTCCGVLNQATILLSLLWLALIVVGFSFLADYDRLANKSAVHMKHWPLASRIKRSSMEKTAVMFVHPLCPCTRASITEFCQLVTNFPQLRPVIVLSYVEPTTDWNRKVIWDRCNSIPGAKIVVDRDGNEINAFRASTSGETFIYNEAGQLLFSGGLTGFRGHEGDNQSLDIAESTANGDLCAPQETPVFGCSLVDDPSPNKEVYSKCAL